jgi:hypothetical protein
VQLTQLCWLLLHLSDHGSLFLCCHGSLRQCKSKRDNLVHCDAQRQLRAERYLLTEQDMRGKALDQQLTVAVISENARECN